jgi:hypothetical protein
LPELLILEVLLVHVVKVLPTHPIDASRSRAVVVQNMLEGLFNPFPFAQQMVQVFKVMGSFCFCFSG